jgi:NAD(P)-dependent dehydrogenase (short-subunit alcohol dehydrogenase family)
MTDKRKVLVLGALSAMAQATARRLAADGAHLVLAGRDAARLEAAALDLRARGAGSVQTLVANLAAVDDPFDMVRDIAERLGGLDAVLIFYGVLGDEAVSARDITELRRQLRVNFDSPIEWAAAAAAVLETSSHPDPVIIAIGSVAGDRGRASNKTYGAAKAGLGVYMQGLAHKGGDKAKRLRAVTIKPGFTDTPMTDGLPKGGPLWSSADRVAQDIVAALSGGGPVRYSPWFWRWVMLIIRLLPQPIMDRLKL